VLYKTYDVVESWDCDFLFTKEEILKWRAEPFYCFILGQHTMQGKINANYRADWKATGYYKRGRSRAFRKEVVRTHLKRGPEFVNVKKVVEREITRYHDSFVRYRGTILKVMVPNTKRTKFKPNVGLNFTIDASSGPFLYNIRDRQFIFAWKRVLEDMPFDFTALLNGRGDWPDRFVDIKLNFDVDWIQNNAIREYHFINYVLSKKKRSWADYNDWFEFRALIAHRGTIY